LDPSIRPYSPNLVPIRAAQIIGLFGPFDVPWAPKGRNECGFELSVTKIPGVPGGTFFGFLRNILWIPEGTFFGFPGFLIKTHKFNN